MDRLRGPFDPYGDPCEHGLPRHSLADSGIDFVHSCVGDRT